MATLNVERLVLPVVSKSSEEDSAAEDRDLQGLEGYVDAVLMPCPGPNALRYNPCKYSVKVEQVEDAKTAADEEVDEEDSMDTRWSAH